MISQKDPKSKGIEGAFMEKSEMRKLAEFIEKLSWDELVKIDMNLCCKNVNESYYLEAIYRLRPDLKLC